jgi:hypothetical protein
MSTPKELIPFLQEMPTMVLNKSHDLVYFDAAETSSTLKNHRIKPKLCDSVFAPHMDVGRLASIQRHEEKAIAANSQNSGHSVAILSHGFGAASGLMGVRLTALAITREVTARDSGLQLRRVHRRVMPQVFRS